MGIEDPLVHLHELQAKHTQPGGAQKIGEGFIAPLMERHFGEFALERAFASDVQLSTYTRELEELLPELSPYLSGEAGVQILLSTTNALHTLSRSIRSSSTQSTQQAILQFWTENLDAIAVMPSTMRKKGEGEDDKVNFIYIHLLRDILTHGNAVQIKQAVSHFESKYFELIDRFLHPPHLSSFPPDALQSAINIVFHQPALDRLRQPILDMMYEHFDDTTITVHEFRRQVPVKELTQHYLYNRLRESLHGEDPLALEDLSQRLREMGVEKPQKLIERWKRGKSPRTHPSYDTQAQLILENYNIVRKLENARQGSVEILANIFNISSFYRFAGYEQRLLDLCAAYDQAEKGIPVPNASLILISPWDNEEIVYGDSKSYNHALTNLETALAKVTGHQITPIYYETTDPEDLPQGLLSMSKIFGQFASGSIKSHGSYVGGIQLDDEDDASFTVDTLTLPHVQEAYQRTFVPNAIIPISSCESYRLAQSLSRLGFRTIGSLIPRPGTTPEDFLISDGDLETTRGSYLVMYQNGAQRQRLHLLPRRR